LAQDGVSAAKYQRVVKAAANWLAKRSPHSLKLVGALVLPGGSFIGRPSFLP